MLLLKNSLEMTALPVVSGLFFYLKVGGCQLCRFVIAVILQWHWA